MIVCPNCRIENDDSLTYCKWCGKPLRPENGKKKPDPRKRRILLIAALAVAAVAAAVMIVAASRPKEGGQKAARPGTTAEAPALTAEPLVTDVDAYFTERGKVISRTDADQSKSVRTEAASAADMDSRGFSGYPVTAEYSISGEYRPETEISAGSETRHPMYSTFYTAANGDIWSISEVNGQVCAFPVTYNMNSGETVQVIVSETESLMSYDSGTNRFYETVPSPETLRVVVVSRIDAETLERLSAEGIEP